MNRLIAISAVICLLVLVGCGIPLTAPPASPSPPTIPPLPTSPSPPLNPTVDTPTITAQPPVTVGPAPQSTQLVLRTYKWTYGGKQWTWELQIPQALYDYYKGLPKSPTPNYSIYVTHPLHSTYLAQLVNNIRSATQREGFGELQTVQFAASFVQSLPYTTDSLSTGYDEYPRYPIETLVDNGGDCEDTAILMASLLKGMGYGVVLIVFPETAASPGHCAVGVLGGEGIYGTYFEYNGGKYFYLETTNTGWAIGQIPDQYKAVRANIYGMTPIPILTHTWAAAGRGGVVDLQVTVSNLGSAAAQGVYVFAGFDAGDNQVWNPQQSLPFQVGVDEKVTVSISLRVPYGKHTRLIVQVAYDGCAVDQSYSEWFDT